MAMTPIADRIRITQYNILNSDIFYSFGCGGTSAGFTTGTVTVTGAAAICAAVIGGGCASSRPDCCCALCSAKVVERNEERADSPATIGAQIIISQPIKLGCASSSAEYGKRAIPKAVKNGMVKATPALS